MKRTEQADLSALRINREAESDNVGNSSYGRLVKIGAVLAIIAFVLVFVFSRTQSSSATGQAAAVTSIFPSQSDAVLTATGYVVAQRQAAIASKGTGQLEFLGVEEGDPVKKGQIIAQLEHNDVAAALAQAEANLEVAQANYEQSKAELTEARLNFERQQGLFEKKLISKSEFDIAESRFLGRQAAVDAAKAGIAQAKAALVAAEVDVENTRIRAPFDGTVLTKNADIGEMVAPFAASSNSRGAVVTIADMNSLEVEADVSESTIQNVDVGQNCEIILDAFPNVRYPAYVHKIVPTADRAKATVLTKIRFKQRDEKVLPEMSAKVNFLAKDSEASEEDSAPVLSVPQSALTKRNERSVVFILRDGKVTETPIMTGRTLGGRIEVTSGLNGGEQVVVNPPEDLDTGDAFQVK